MHPILAQWQHAQIGPHRSERFRYWAAKAGHRASFHQLRARFITETYIATRHDAFTTRDQARHSSIRTLEHYVPGRRDKAREAAARLPASGVLQRPESTPLVEIVASVTSRIETDQVAAIAEISQRLLRLSQLESLALQAASLTTGNPST